MQSKCWIIFSVLEIHLAKISNNKFCVKIVSQKKHFSKEQTNNYTKYDIKC